MKTSSIFVCQKCGAQSPKWAGRCSECGTWNSLVEETRVNNQGKQDKRVNFTKEIRPVLASQVSLQKKKRLSTGMREVDQVLGGGIVAGSAVLFSGQPGIGKSTLLSQIALNLAEKDHLVIYACGEESPEQVKIRLNRLGLSEKTDNLILFPETNVDLLIEIVQKDYVKGERALLIVDSIQTLITNDLAGVAGSIGQVRETTGRLIQLAKFKQIPIFIVGHVTKSGSLAGPKTIEHAVDTVLYFEGERSSDLRLLRAVKNRFGPADEVGVFEMTNKGLKEIINPSLIQLDKNQSSIGLAYCVVFEGTRPMVVEIQSLVVKSFAPMPKRVVNGIDKRRAEMLIAVVQKYLRLPLWEYDVFINIAGGFKVTEPAADLAICAAILSSYKNKALKPKTVFVGEVSLLGNVFSVSKQEKRQRQARALGLKDFVASKNCPYLNNLKKFLINS